MRVGVCTGGGDCPGLNAAIRAVVRHGTLHHRLEMIGILNSINGLLEDPPHFRQLGLSDVSGIFDRGGTILGTSNKGSPFKDAASTAASITKLKKSWRSIGLDALIVIGGDGTQTMSQQISASGLNVIGIPKTIDNDYTPTEISIGFATAVDVAANAIQRLHSTAEAHSRYMIVEVMGRDAGYIALHAGIASGASIILLPEIPYSYEAMLAKINERGTRGRKFGVVVVAEGAFEKGQKPIFRSSATGTLNLGGVADEVARQLHTRSGFDTRVTVLGHVQRGGDPMPSDIILASLFGVHAMDLVAQKKFGRVVGLQRGHISDTAFADIARQTRCLALNDSYIHTAEAIGICLGR